MDTYSVRYERIAFFFSLYRIMPSQLTYSIRALNAEHTKFIYEFMAIEYTRHTHTHTSAERSIQAINVIVNVELKKIVFRPTAFR